jgi:hypothetical protein
VKHTLSNFCRARAYHLLDVECRLSLGPGRYRSQRHRLPFKKRGVKIPVGNEVGK